MQVTIEKLVYGGDGLARLPAAPGSGHERGKALFVPLVLPGEVAEVTTFSSKPGFERANLDKLIAPSPERIEPGCKYFGRCGGCHYQHTGYDNQLRIKTEILRETLQRTATIEWPGEIPAHASPPWNYRNRTRMRVRHAPFAIGYYRFSSHELLPVEQCPISSPLINRAITAVWALGAAGGLPANVHEIEFFAGGEDQELQLEVFLDAAAAEPVNHEAVAQALAGALPEASGIAFYSARPKRGEPCVVTSEGPLFSFGELALHYRAAAGTYRVSAGAFFQTNRFLTDKLVELVTAGQRGATALDLYAGVGLFTLPLAKTFERVIAVEPAAPAVDDLRCNVPADVKIVTATTERYLEQMPKKLRPDLVVVDPPRAGLGEKVARRLAALAPPRLTYLSCDPATLSRDLRMLLESGYRAEQVHLIDLFPQTFHIESLVHLVR